MAARPPLNPCALTGAPQSDGRVLDDHAVGLRHATWFRGTTVVGSVIRLVRDRRVVELVLHVHPDGAVLDLAGIHGDRG
ncbi:MAG: hypothetical protein QOI69_876, partial [Pseudonocardiales bacterium]|nr:hypothetical protein [Pseudonocardiales bacterium]